MLMVVVLLLATPISAKQTELRTNISPSTELIPENTLRLYLSFSKPMQRGQVREQIRLIDATNDMSVPNVFLNLVTELWDYEQKQLTLLFDPGRVKYLVGPNQRYGPPLLKGNKYSLVINQGMRDAYGDTIGYEIRHTFVAGEAELRAISPETDWLITPPNENSRNVLHIQFDRLMDTVASKRFIKVRETASGEFIAGEVLSDGKTWQLVPESAWKKGKYEIVVDKEIEDVSGNTLGAPFNVKQEKNRRNLDRTEATIQFEISS